MYGEWTTTKANATERSPGEAKSHSANQETSLLLWDPKVHYRVHKRPPLVPTWARWNHFTLSHPISLRSILILSSHPRLSLSSGLFPSGFPTKILYTFIE